MGLKLALAAIDTSEDPFPVVHGGASRCTQSRQPSTRQFPGLASNLHQGPVQRPSAQNPRQTSNWQPTGPLHLTSGRAKRQRAASGTSPGLSKGLSKGLNAQKLPGLRPIPKAVEKADAWATTNGPVTCMLHVVCIIAFASRLDGSKRPALYFQDLTNLL